MNEEAIFRRGDRIANHEVLEHLGVLGAADRYVVRAPDGTLRTAGVLPVRHPEMVDRLQALGLDRVRHRNVVSVTEVLEIGSSPVMVTSQVPGVTLRERLAEGPMAVEPALALFRGIVEGLGAAHAIGLTHRDLRPENVVVDGGIARVLDLGVAEALFDLVGAGRGVTTSGTTIGKPHYWAPERARRPQSADARSDLFSVGCLLYEMLAGEGPFAGLNLYDCYHATLEERYVPLEQRRQNLPPALLHLVPALLRADPARRPQSAAEVLERLEHFTLSEHDDPPATGTTDEVPRGAPRPTAGVARPLVPWLAVGGCAALLALVTTWWWLGG